MPFQINATLLWFSGDPFYEGKKAVNIIEDGALIVDGDKIAWRGERSEVPSDYVIDNVEDHRGKILLPGFVDCHLHFPQTRMIGAYGSDLLYWLNTYTFPEEAKYKDPELARRLADIFLQELSRHGITTACAFSTVHTASAEALFEAATAQNRCILTGKVMMDRNAIPELQDTPQSSYDDSLVLAQKYDGSSRSKYVISPRFAITSTPEQLEMTRQLARELPNSLIQTHINESAREIDFVQELFPNSKHYLDVYDHYDLVSDRLLLAHAIHNTPDEWARMAETNAKVVHCPTSNTFLGSGLFEAHTMREREINFALGCDIGGGTTFSTLATMGEAYKVARFHDISLTAFETYYMATLGGAKLLNLDHEIGKLEPGYFADLVLLDPVTTPLMAERQTLSGEIDAPIEDVLFALQFADGPGNAVVKCWVGGEFYISTTINPLGSHKY